tara:strand:+ start:271 stop:861 length:591 start_codon:yes stop_codon:yes gene_type:complete
MQTEDPASSCVLYEYESGAEFETPQNPLFRVRKERKCGFDGLDGVHYCQMLTCHSAKTHVFCFHCWNDIVLKQWCYVDSNVNRSKCLMCKPIELEPVSSPAATVADSSFGSSVEALSPASAPKWDLVVDLEDTSPEQGRRIGRFTSGNTPEYYRGPGDDGKFREMGIDVPEDIKEQVSQEAKHQYCANVTVDVLFE